MGWVQAPESSPAVWSQDSTLPSPNKKKALPHGRPRQNYKPFPIAMDMAEGLRLLAIALGKACAMGVTGTCWASRLVLHSGDGWGTGRKSPSVIHMFNNRKTTLAICTGLHCNTLWQHCDPCFIISFLLHVPIHRQHPAKVHLQALLQFSKATLTELLPFIICSSMSFINYFHLKKQSHHNWTFSYKKWLLQGRGKLLERKYPSGSHCPVPGNISSSLS